MLIYSGRGWVVIPLFMSVMIGGLIFFKNFKQDSPIYLTPWPEIISAVINVLGCAVLGWWLNRGIPRKIIEFVTPPGRTIGHTFCFVRVEYCGCFSILFFGIGLFKGGLFH